MPYIWGDWGKLESTGPSRDGSQYSSQAAGGEVGMQTSPNF